MVFLTIFLVLLYHLTCVLHSISCAKENLEAWDTVRVKTFNLRKKNGKEEEVKRHVPERICQYQMK